MVRTIAARSTAQTGSFAAAEMAIAARTNMIAIAVVMSSRPALKSLLAAARTIRLDCAMRSASAVANGRVHAFAWREILSRPSGLRRRRSGTRRAAVRSFRRKPIEHLEQCVYLFYLHG